jgi:ParB family transcriptional regulator, chromosome partitioning protein
MENNKENQNKKRLGRGIGSLLGGASYNGDFSSEQKAPAAPAPKQNQQIDQNQNKAASAASQPTLSPEQLSQQKANFQNMAAQKKATIISRPGDSIPATSAIKPAMSPTAISLVQQNEVPAESRVWNIAIDKIVPGIFQPRKTFEKEKIEELAQSIRENGILQPIAVRKRPAGGYEIIAGERRWRAAQAAGLHEVPALIKNISDRETLQLAIIENVQRQDLDPIEEADGYARLIKEFGYSQQEVATRVGKERATVANSLRLNSLPQSIKDMISLGKVSTGHAKVLLSLDNQNKQIELAQELIAKELSVRALEVLVKQEKFKNETAELNSHSDTQNLKAGLSAMDPKQDLRKSLAQELANQLQKKLGTKVAIQYNEGRGNLNIQFYTDDQLNQIFEMLVQEQKGPQKK